MSRRVLVGTLVVLAGCMASVSEDGDALKSSPNPSSTNPRTVEEWANLVNSTHQTLVDAQRVEAQKLCGCGFEAAVWKAGQAELNSGLLTRDTGSGQGEEEGAETEEASINSVDFDRVFEQVFACDGKSKPVSCSTQEDCDDSVLAAMNRVLPQLAGSDDVAAVAEVAKALISGIEEDIRVATNNAACMTEAHCQASITSTLTDSCRDVPAEKPSLDCKGLDDSYEGDFVHSGVNTLVNCIHESDDASSVGHAGTSTSVGTPVGDP